jgi:O-methyltransferase
MHIINRIIYLSTLKNNNLARKIAISKSIDFISNNRIRGYFIEFGVGTGTTLKIFLEASQIKKYDFLGAIGYDTFEGFPETGGLENNHYLNKIKIGSRNSSMEKILSSKLKKIDKSKYSLYSVNIETDELNIDEHISENEKNSLLHFDLDYSIPTLNAFNQVHKKFQIGTVLMFDNFYFFSGWDRLGERLALSTFLRKHPNLKIGAYFQYGWHGQAFIVNDLNDAK